MYIPETHFDVKRVKQKFICAEIQTGDGKKQHWKSYIGTIKINDKKFTTSVVVGTEKIILGRGILDKLVSIFDGPNKKIILNGT